jgi:hypothetical protein
LLSRLQACRDRSKPSRVSAWTSDTTKITNLVLSGLMTVAFAVGLRRALGGGRGAVWAPRLIGEPDEARREFERAATLTRNERERSLFLARAAGLPGV